MEEKRTAFLGTYFSKETMLRLAAVARISSWVVVGIYLAQFLTQVAIIFLQFSRGFWAGMGYTDIAMTVITLFEQCLRGVVYFIVLQAVTQVLLLFMDVEDNTRRMARK